jgi:hypothetical protein
MNKLNHALLYLIVFMFVAGASQAQVLYGAATGLETGNAPSSLYTIDPATGDANLIGPIGFNAVTGLAFLTDGRLVASANADVDGQVIAILIEIDPSTGAGTYIGELGNFNNDGECGRMPDLAFSCELNQLYGYGDFCSGDTEGLYLINPDNADAVSIGPSGYHGGGNGLAIQARTLTTFGTPFDNLSLITINLNTGAGTEIPGSAGNVPNAINALDFNPQTGVLYGSFRDFNDFVSTEFLSYLVTINTSDGTTTIIGQTVLGLDAIAFDDNCMVIIPAEVPTLSEWGLIAMAGLLGIIGFMVIRRRKATA